MTNEVRPRISLIDNASGKLAKIRDGFGTVFGAKMTRQFTAGNIASQAFAKGMSIVGDAVSAVGDFMADSIDAASGLNEAMSKSNVVFGGNASAMDRWAEGASEAFGQSKRAALEYAGTYGNLLQAFGVGQDEAAGMSQRLVELASDLASFNNTSVDDALVALRSGLSGETEPLKRYGVALSDARMRQELMAQGVTDLGTTLTPLQKATASYALILKDTALAQGDFARTADELANSQRTATAELEDAQAALGKRLLPVQLAVTKAQIGAASALALLIEGTESLGDESEMTGEKLEETADALDFLSGWPGIAGDAFRGMAQETRDASRAQTDFNGQIAGFGRIIPKVTEDTEEWDEANSESAKSVERHKEALQKAEEAMDTYADAQFGATVKTGDLEQAKKDLDELIKEGPESKSAQDTAIWEGKVADLRETILKLELDLARIAGDTAVYDWLQKQQEGWRDLTSVAQAAYWAQRAASLLSLQTAPITFVEDYMDRITDLLDTGEPRAHGGPVTAGKAYTVGEQGPELFVPKTSGTIVPNGATVGGSGGSSLTFVYSPTYSTASQAEAQRLAAALGPSIIRWARTSGVAV